MQSLVNKGREDFIRHPMTQGVINGAVFLMTGGIEGVVALGNIGKFFVKPAASQLTRVFWSGGVCKEAMNFARANGMTTLEMTRAGQNLTKLTENSRYSMSVVVELRKSDGSLVDSEEQNRYIIVNNNENMQETAQKLLTKLLEDALTALSGKLNSLLKY